MSSTTTKLYTAPSNVELKPVPLFRTISLGAVFGNSTLKDKVAFGDVADLGV